MGAPPTARKKARSARRTQAGAPAPTVRYLEVKRFLKSELANRRWLPGALMPSEAELVAQFGVSRMTVNRALRELVAEGLVERIKGVGTFAAQLQRVSSRLTIRNLHDEILERGHAHRSELHLLRQEAASEGLAQQMKLAEGAAIFHSVIVHHENGLPLQLEDRYVNPACAPNYLEVDFDSITPTQYLLEVAPLWEAQYTVMAALASPQEARWLGISGREPCLVVVRRTSNLGTPITLVRLTHPGSRYQLDGQFAP